MCPSTLGRIVRRKEIGRVPGRVPLRGGLDLVPVVFFFFAAHQGPRRVRGGIGRKKVRQVISGRRRRVIISLRGSVHFVSSDGHDTRSPQPNPAGFSFAPFFSAPLPPFQHASEVLRLVWGWTPGTKLAHFCPNLMACIVFFFLRTTHLSLDNPGSTLFFPLPFGCAMTCQSRGLSRLPSLSFSADTQSTTQSGQSKPKRGRKKKGQKPRIQCRKATIRKDSHSSSLQHVS